MVISFTTFFFLKLGFNESNWGKVEKNLSLCKPLSIWINNGA
jgi:hypothetical protein